MPNCDHVGPEQVIEWGEQLLRERNVPEAHWNGARFSWRGNVDATTSVHVEVLRESDDWRVTQLQRRRGETVADEESGYRALHVPS